MLVAIPSNKPGGLEATISPHFGRCDVFTIIELVDKKVKKVRVMANQGEHFGSAKTPTEILILGGINAVVMKGMGPKAVLMMREYGIEIYATSASTVDQAVRELIDGKARTASDEDACKESRDHVHAHSFPGHMCGAEGGMGRGGGCSASPGVSHSPTAFQKPQANYSKSQGLKVGVANQGSGGLEDTVSPIFGRCPSFTILEVTGKEIKNVKVVPNQFLSSSSGAGIAVVQMLAGEGVKYILAGRFGPNVSTVAGQFGIQMVTILPGMKIRDAINQHIIGSI